VLATTGPNASVATLPAVTPLQATPGADAGDIDGELESADPDSSADTIAPSFRSATLHPASRRGR
jgi:hypothetical protein